jgi:hypothetical protein
MEYMSAKVIFTTPPYGDEIVNPDLRFIEILILYVNNEYWCAGPGQAWLDYKTDKLTYKLVLTFDINYGFYLEYKDAKEDKFSSFGKGDFEHSVTVYVGGDPWILPTKFFVSRNEAWLAVKHFCETGEMYGEITWARSSDVDWHYGME